MSALEYDIDGMLDLARRAAGAVDRGFGPVVDADESSTGDARLASVISGFHARWIPTIEALVAAGLDSGIRVGVAAELYDQADADSISGSRGDGIERVIVDGGHDGPDRAIR